MKGQVCLVTGANTGVGLETARGLAERGATVVMTSRNKAKGEVAVADVIRTTKNHEVSLLLLDLSSVAAVREAAREFRERHDQLHLLINNAGLILSDRQETVDGHECTFAVNHLGHFLLTHLLIDRLEASVPARVIHVSSEAHRQSGGLDFDDLMHRRRRYSGLSAYADSKLANILFTRELARRHEHTGVVSHAVHPGVVRSGFAGDGDVRGWVGWALSLARPFMLTPAKGARTSIHVATSDEAGSCTGLYWKRARRAKPSRHGRNDVAAKRLWQVSERLLEL